MNKENYIVRVVRNLYYIIFQVVWDKKYCLYETFPHKNGHNYRKFFSSVILLGIPAIISTYKTIRMLTYRNVKFTVQR